MALAWYDWNRFGTRYEPLTNRFLVRSRKPIDNHTFPKKVDTFSKKVDTYSQCSKLLFLYVLVHRVLQNVENPHKT